MTKSTNRLTSVKTRDRDLEIKKVLDYLSKDANYTLSDIKTVIQKIFSVTRPQITASFDRLGVQSSKRIQLHTPSGNPDTYICPVCKEEKPKSDFSSKGKHRDGVTPRVYPYCKKCATAYQKPITLRRQYGLTMEQYEKLGETCLICGRVRKSGGYSYAVDHDHKTGLIRGRLCARCNRGLAWFQDNIELFQHCIDYLLDPPATAILGVAVYGRTGRTTNKRNKKKLLSRSAIKEIKENSGVSDEFVL